MTIKVHDKHEKKTVEMHHVDAQHAVAVEPDRYEIVAEEKVLTIEERVARLEAKIFPAKEKAKEPAAKEPSKERIEL
jgi:hypothetical protein